MKNNYFIFFLILIIFSSCEKENKTLKNEKHLPENILPLSQEYSWEQSNSDNDFGEILFVPVYSTIYHQSDRTFDLTATLSIHNVDINSNITVIKTDYYNTDGKLMQRFIKDEIVLTPLQSEQFIIKQTDKSGGTAAKFIVQWVSEEQVLKPIVEAVMISTSSQQGISFKTESRIISSIGY
ncbi:MAG: DUF3124 domain-containing protein [Ignavibacteriae bacterium]|nr:DUF3124 domain-containing protein [Ignavibacteriota bacterium]NOG98396.1 DUF3124 domain-containing protein [Ignavibacteriota bacterium]